MATDLQAEDNQKWNLFKVFSTESKAVTIAQTSLIISVVFAGIAALAMYDATQANATSETWKAMYNETERECRLAQAQINDFRVALFKAGIEVEHTGETP